MLISCIICLIRTEGNARGSQYRYIDRFKTIIYYQRLIIIYNLIVLN